MRGLSRDVANTYVFGGMLCICIAIVLALLGLILAEGLPAFWPRSIELRIADNQLYLGQRVDRLGETYLFRASSPSENAAETLTFSAPTWLQSEAVKINEAVRLEQLGFPEVFGIPLNLQAVPDLESTLEQSQLAYFIRYTLDPWLSAQRAKTSDSESVVFAEFETFLKSLNEQSPAMEPPELSVPRPLASLDELNELLRSLHHVREDIQQLQIEMASRDQQQLSLQEQLANYVSVAMLRDSATSLLEQKVLSEWQTAQIHILESKVTSSTAEGDLRLLSELLSEFRGNLENSQRLAQTELEEWFSNQGFPSAQRAAVESLFQKLETGLIQRYRLSSRIYSQQQLLLSSQLELAIPTADAPLELAPRTARALVDRASAASPLGEPFLQQLCDAFADAPASWLETPPDWEVQPLSPNYFLLTIGSGVQRRLALLQYSLNGQLWLLENQVINLGNTERVLALNTYSSSQKLMLYFARWKNFLFGMPQITNSSGGIFPAIWGTIVLTLIMSIAVVPLGVVVALYLREYTQGGTLVSIVRISIHNLAGVPSVVYGVFGVAFFCYTLGAFLDGGPRNANIEVLPPPIWFLCLGLLSVTGTLAFLLTLRYSRGRTSPTPWLPRLALFMWICCLVGGCLMLLKSPFFDGFYQDSLPNPTFGKGGILWASLTLALLTLPIVIVTTEEALVLVPNSLRVGSYACGASKWQTIWNIILPYASPGILTGSILASAKAVGQVAPLMLVGALPYVKDLPLDGQFPYLHVSRSFMHLGNQIYSLGMQSSDTQASQPMVYATIMLLVFVVATLHLTANFVRSRFLARFPEA